MRLRVAEASDLDAIMALEEASFPTDAWSRASMREELASPHGWYVVLVDDARIAGYAGLRAPQGGREADVQTIAVAAASRGRGGGRLLLRALLAEARERRAREVFLEVRADNPVAAALYTAEGFVEIGRRPRYYQPDDVDAVVMRLDLAASAIPDLMRAQGESAPDRPRTPDSADSVDSALRAQRGSAGTTVIAATEGGDV